MPNNVEVSKAFKKFFILVLISVAAGKIFRAVVQEVLDTRWSFFSRSLKEKGIEATSPQIIFSRLGVPTVGAVIENLNYQTQVKCFEYKVSAEQLFLPLKISKLFLFKVEFGTLRIDKTQFTFREIPDCVLSQANEKPDSGSEPSFQDVEPIQMSSEAKPSLPWLESLSKWFVVHQARIGRMPIRSFDLKTVEIFGENQKEKKVSGTGSVQVELDNDIQAQVVFDKLVLGKTSRSVTTEFHAQLAANAQKIHVRGDWAYYEGHLTADFEFDRDDNVRLDLQSKDLPLSVLNRWFDTPWTFQFLWFQCGLRVSTNKINWDQAPWSVDGCQITGPYGKVDFLAEKTASLKQFDHLQINFKEIQMDRILNGKEQFPFSGVIKDYGIFNGQLNLRKNTVDGKWSLQDTSVLFSKNNKRHLQIVNKAGGRFEYKKGEALFELDSAKIKDGDFAGTVRFIYDRYKKQLQSSSRLQKLSFSPEIQKLMLNGEISPLSLEGDLTFLEEDSSLRGQLKAEAQSFKSLNAAAQNITGLFGWSDSAPQIVLSAEKITIEKGEDHSWLFASLLQESLSLLRIELSQIYTKWQKPDSSSKTLILEKATALAPGIGRLSLAGKVSWEEGQGQAQWQTSAGSSLDWEWSYRGSALTWIPQNKQMRDWLLSHEEWVSEYPFIR